jgi:hypothetical protein
MRSDPHSRIRLIGRVGLVAVFLFACSGGESRVQARGIATIGVEGRSNENVTLVAARDFVVAAWSATKGDTTDIYSAVSVDGGSTWGLPLRVNSTPGEARAGGEQPPRIALLPPRGIHDPNVVIMWAARGANGTRLLFATSTDGGRTYGKSEVVPGAAAAGNRGWQSLAVNDKGQAVALWLDHREAVSSTPSAMHQHGTAKAESKAPAAPRPDPVEKANHSQIWLGSLDGTIAARGLTGGVCYCCKTALVTSGQNVYAAWRHVFPGNQRDIALVASHDGGRTFGAVVRVSEDKWQFDGCPENGPALAIGPGGEVHVAWVTPEQGKEGAPLALYHATSRDGSAFTPRVRIPTQGAAGHVQIVSGPSPALTLAWDEATPSGRRVRLAGAIAREGREATFSALPNPDDAEGLYPALATTAKGTVVAWVRRGGPATTIAVTTRP